MEVAGYMVSALIGISLGLIGGGGSILTVPVLVYLFSLDPIAATSYSLFIVGSTSLVGAINNFNKGFVDTGTVVLFGVPSVATVYLVRRLVVPMIPERLLVIGTFTVTAAFVIMLLFAALMIAASISMIKDSRAVKASSGSKSVYLLLLYGIAIGIITGLLGAGGGFLLIPALIFIVELPMKNAIGTSLFIIALNSLTGFAGDIGTHVIDWPLLLTITAIAIFGVLVGTRLSRSIDGKKLKKYFGWFVLIIGTSILIKEILLK